MPAPLTPLEPRGTRRILFDSDPSVITGYMFDRLDEEANMTRFPLVSSPARPDELRRYVDVIATSRVDTYLQDVFAEGWTLYFRSEQFEYHQAPQHQRFIPLLDAGVTPLEVLIDQSHQHGMEFVASFRVNDRHPVMSGHSTGGDRPQGARWVLENDHLLLKALPPGRNYAPGNLQDYTFPEVRNYLLGVVSEVVDRFDVDGIQLTFRDGIYFPYPPSIARERQPLMTELIRRIRDVIEAGSRGGGKRLQLGVVVPETISGCQDQGLDVAAWIKEGLLDWVSPGDVMYTDFNARYEEFSALTRAAECMLYPLAFPYCAHRDRPSPPFTAENYRALAQSYYAAGADGIHIYNYQMHWDQNRTHVTVPFEQRNIHGPATGYLLAPQYLKEIRDPASAETYARHYLFHPMWHGFDGYVPGAPAPGSARDDVLVLRRDQPDSGQRFRFRLCEDLDRVSLSTLYFCATGLGPADAIVVDVNGAVVPRERVHGTWHPLGRPRYLGRPLPPYSQCWFDLSDLPLANGDNYLGVRLDATAMGMGSRAPSPETVREVVIDEVEVIVLP